MVDQWPISSMSVLRWKPFAALPHCIFPGRPVALIAPRLIVSRRSLCRERPPRHLKIRACKVKGRSGAARLFARVGAGIEAAEPLPRFLVMRLTYAGRDRADVNSSK